MNFVAPGHREIEINIKAKPIKAKAIKMIQVIIITVGVVGWMLWRLGRVSRTPGVTEPSEEVFEDTTDIVEENEEIPFAIYVNRYGRIRKFYGVSQEHCNKLLEEIRSNLVTMSVVQKEDKRCISFNPN